MKHRSEDERIQELEAKIEAIRARSVRKKAKANPAIKLTVGAVKLLDKALNATSDAMLRRELETARTTLSACASLEGLVMPPAGATHEIKRKPGRPRKVAV